MAFAIVLTVLTGVVGLAIDYGRSTLVRIRLQSAVDAAVLAASSPLVAAEQRKAVFDSVFAANYPSDQPTPAAVDFKYKEGSGGTGTAVLDLKLALMPVLGQTDVRIAVKSSTALSGVDYEIVMVLDISGSMRAPMGSGSRMGAMKSAAKRLIDKITANLSSGHSAKFAIVPFTMAVNIGTANDAYVENTTNPLFASSPWAGCVLERKGGFHHKDVFSPGATDGSGMWQAYVWPPEPNSGWCLNKSNGTNGGYQLPEPAPLGKNAWVNGPNFNCPRYQLVPLTNAADTVRQAIEDLNPYGNVGTTIGPGVGWAARLLSPAEPFTEGAPFSKATRKIMVVLTDGEMVTDGGDGCSTGTNSTTPYAFDPESLQLQGKKLTAPPTVDSFTPYGYLADSDPFSNGVTTAAAADLELDRLSLEACTEAKALTSGDGAIALYTIAVSTGAGPGTRAFSVLSKCASSGHHFFYAADSAELDSAFDKITEQSVSLRLTQ